MSVSRDLIPSTRPSGFALPRVVFLAGLAGFATVVLCLTGVTTGISVAHADPKGPSPKAPDDDETPPPPPLNPYEQNPPPVQTPPTPPPGPASQPIRHPRPAPSASVVDSHEGQFGIYAQVGIGYRALFRYQSNQFCGQAGQAVCTGTEPPFMEIGLDYAVSRQVELLAEVRFGLSDDFKPSTSTGSAPKELGFNPGVKIYLDETGTTKLFTTFQIAIDRTNYAVDNVAAPTDIGLRNVNGFQFDVHRTFGIYLHLGETLSFVRWASVALDGGIGMQVRFP